MLVLFKMIKMRKREKRSNRQATMQCKQWRHCNNEHDNDDGKTLSLCKLDEGCRKRANPLNSPILNKFCKRDAHSLNAKMEYCRSFYSFGFNIFLFFGFSSTTIFYDNNFTVRKVFHLTHFIYNLIIKIVLKIYYFISHLATRFFVSFSSF